MIAARIAEVTDRIARACARAGRSPGDVTLVAVTKTLAPDAINQAIAAGLTRIGENRVQEYLGKREALLPHEFHMIGTLQRNKVKAVLPYCTLIHAVDSLPLAREIDERSERLGRRTDVLLEVNVSGEESKHGLPPADVPRVFDAVRELRNIRCRGLMTIAEYTPDPEAVRPSLRMMRTLQERVRADAAAPDFDQLSMGMSHDFEIAIEEGATIIRLGTVLFGPRPD